MPKPETTALVLVEEFSHRVLNEYTQAIAQLSAVARCADNENVRRHLSDAADRLYAHAHAHRALAMPPLGTQFDVAEYLGRVCSAVANALTPDAGVRMVVGEINLVMPAERCWRLALIASELIHNASRHGGASGEIVVELSLAGTDLVCRVSNDGACQPSTALGRGRRVVAALARELGGHADWLFSPVGACAWVMVPVERPPRTDII